MAYKDKQVLVIIPARGGSKGVPGKNIKLLAGKPLIAWTIEVALQSDLVDRVIVSTDDEKIAAVAKEYGAEVPFLRPIEISGDRATDVEFIEHALDYFETQESYVPDIILRLPPTSPLRTVEHIDMGIMTLVDTKGADAARPIVESPKHPYKFWMIDEEDSVFLRPFLNTEFTGFVEPHNMPRQLFPTVYMHTGALDAVWVKTIREQKSTSGKKLAHFKMDMESSSNIDHSIDFEIAEVLMSKRIQNVKAKTNTFLKRESGDAINHPNSLSMKKVLIYGAGSIGNHLSQAARKMGFAVTVCDPNVDALERMKTSIYPTRYGTWDEEITLIQSDSDVVTGDFDIIAIGTPPDIHKDLALKAIKFNPRILHIEKPLFRPTDDGEAFARTIAEYPDTMVTVGYDHAIAPSFTAFLEYIKSGRYGKLITVDGATREHWEGIFKAHPWLKGPHDSYLGFTSRGGGSACEHSHALHLTLTTLEAGGWKGIEGTCELDMVKGENGESYDRASFFTLKNGSGQVARVVQDVVTKPTEKMVRAQLENAIVTWRCESGTDIVEVNGYNGEQVIRKFTKTRPDDFYYLMKHYSALLDGSIKYSETPIRVASGLATMKIIATGLVS